MGIDTTLYLEIKRQEQWHRLSLGTPFQGPGEEIRSACPSGFSCRYYHFEKMIRNAPSHVPNDKKELSDEALAELEEEGDSILGFGVFMFEDLDHYCESLEKTMLGYLSRSELFVMKEQLNRIEELLLEFSRGKHPDNRPDREQYTFQSLEDIYYEFMEDDGVTLDYWRGICALTLIVPDLHLNDLRIFYTIW